MKKYFFILNLLMGTVVLADSSHKKDSVEIYEGISSYTHSNDNKCIVKIIKNNSKVITSISISAPAILTRISSDSKFLSSQATSFDPTLSEEINFSKLDWNTSQYWYRNSFSMKASSTNKYLVRTTYWIELGIDKHLNLIGIKEDFVKKNIYFLISELRQKKCFDLRKITL